MKYLIQLLIVPICLYAIVASSNFPHMTNESDSSQIVSIEKKRHDQNKNEINSYFLNHSLVVKDKNNSELKRIKIFAVDSLYRIVQSQNENSLFIGLSSYGDAIFQFMGLIDLKSKKWIIYKNLDSKSDDWRNCVLPNPNYLGSTSDNKYHLFEGGTGVIREFQIYDQNGNLAKKGSYVIGIKNMEFKWDYLDRLQYFERSDSFPNSLPKPKENFGYIQKKYWFDGKDSLTHDFLEIYFE